MGGGGVLGVIVGNNRRGHSGRRPMDTVKEINKLGLSELLETVYDWTEWRIMTRKVTRC